MTREEHLEFCKVCQNQQFDRQQGIVCGLTGQVADFDPSCDDFALDEEKKASMDQQPVQTKVLANTVGLGKRFTNFILDTIFMYVFVFVIGFRMAFMASSIEIFTGVSVEELFENPLAINLIVYGSYFLYFTLMESITGKSFAKFITKTKVVNLKGDKPSVGSVLLRTLCRFIPFEPLSFFFGSDRTGWHDTFSKTRVVHAG